MLEKLRELDFELFKLVHHQLKNPLADFVAPWLRERFFWIPIYLLIIYWVVSQFQRRGLIFLAYTIGLIGFVNTFNSEVLKKSVQRLRPCRTPELADVYHSLVDCGGGFSFPSSHAANHFALAAFLYLVFNTRFQYPRFWFVWAASIALSQVYVGVHFVSDIAFGALEGVFFAYLLYYFTYRKHPLTT